MVVLTHLHGEHNNAINADIGPVGDGLSGVVIAFTREYLERTVRSPVPVMASR